MKTARIDALLAGVSRATTATALGDLEARSLLACLWNGSAHGLPQIAILRTFSILVVHHYAIESATIATTLDAGVSAETFDSEASDDRDTELILRQTQAYFLFLRAGHHNAAMHERYRNAWETFYATYDPVVRRVVYAYRLQKADVDDCVQTAWAEIVRALASISCDPARGRLSSWLSTITRRNASRFVRGNRKRSNAFAELEDSIADGSGNPEAVFERNETRELVWRTLAVLRSQVSEETYQVLCLHSMEGHMTSEVARLLDLSPGQVRGRWRDAKQKFHLLYGAAVDG